MVQGHFLELDTEVEAAGYGKYQRLVQQDVSTQRGHSSIKEEENGGSRSCCEAVGQLPSCDVGSWNQG